MVITKLVRRQQQHIGTDVGNRMAPGAAGRAEEQSVVAVQPGKIAIRRRHNGGSHLDVAPGTGGFNAGFGRSRAIRMTWETIQMGVREVSTAKHGKNSLQVPLLAEQEGFERPTSHWATTIKDVLVHVMGNALLGGLGAQAEMLGQRASALDLIRIHQ
jgi:hypothetical protein